MRDLLTFTGFASVVVTADSMVAEESRGAFEGMYRLSVVTGTTKIMRVNNTATIRNVKCRSVVLGAGGLPSTFVRCIHSVLGL
jgi:hypothetical protein